MSQPEKGIDLMHALTKSLRATDLKEALDAFEEACWTSPSEAPAMRQRVETVFAKLEARYEEARDSRNMLIRRLGGVPA